MKKPQILICPDKFKGSITAEQLTTIIASCIPQNINVVKMPLADGGQGSLETISKYISGYWVDLKVHNPLWKIIYSKYYISQDNSIAFIQMAKASGLCLLKKQQYNPMLTTTFGIGQLILDAISRKVRQVLLFIGGSSTQDGGIGMLAALGYRFFNEQMKELEPNGGNLRFIKSFSKPQSLSEKIKGIQIKILCDVKNPLTGQNGSAKIYSRQKGALQQQVQLLEQGLINFARLIKKQYSLDLQQMPGTGSAGGIGAGAMAFLGGKIYSGIEEVFKLIKFGDVVKKANLIITGQGKVDEQTIYGKLVKGVLDEIDQTQQLWIICGICQLQKNNKLQANHPNVKIFPLVNEKITVQFAMKNTNQLVKEIMKKKMYQYVNSFE